MLMIINIIKSGGFFYFCKKQFFVVSSSQMTFSVFAFNVILFKFRSSVVSFVCSKLLHKECPTSRIVPTREKVVFPAAQPNVRNHTFEKFQLIRILLIYLFDVLLSNFGNFVFLWPKVSKHKKLIRCYAVSGLRDFFCLAL